VKVYFDAQMMSCNLISYWHVIIKLFHVKCNVKLHVIYYVIEHVILFVIGM